MNDLISLGSGCLIWIPIAIMAVSLVNWAVAGEVDVITMILGLAAAVALGWFAFNPPAPIYAPLSLFVAIATCVCYPFLRMTMHVRELKEYEVEQLEAAYSILSVRPRDPLAKFRVARQMHILGYPVHAVKIAEKVMPDLPANLFVDENRMYRNWKFEEGDPEAAKPIRCVDCGTQNEPGHIHCRNCGAQHLIAKVRGRVLPAAQGKKLVALWISMVAVLMGMPLVAQLPPLASVALVVGLFGFVGLALFLAFRSPEAESAH